MRRGRVMDLRLGDWREALAGVDKVSSIITDPPYSARTHAGHNKGTEIKNAVQTKHRGWMRASGIPDTLRLRRDITYSHITPEDCREFVDAWAPRCRGWFAVMSDDELIVQWREAFQANGLTAFQAIPCVIPGMTVRQCGDGPSSWAVYLNVARPKALSKWGTLPGAYRSGRGQRGHIGGKPLELMEAIVRDYTRTGDLVCDPFAGHATTLFAAHRLGRRSVGCELDAETYAKASERLLGLGPMNDPRQPNLFERMTP